MEPLEFEITGLVHLERDMNRIPQALEEAFAGVAEDVRFTWKLWGVATGAVDSYDFVKSIGEHKLDAHEFIIDTSNNENVNYSDIIERGRTDRPNYPDRHPAELALDSLDAADFVGTRVTDAFDKILQQ